MKPLLIFFIALLLVAIALACVVTGVLSIIAQSWLPAELFWGNAIDFITKWYGLIIAAIIVILLFGFKKVTKNLK